MTIESALFKLSPARPIHIAMSIVAGGDMKCLDAIRLIASNLTMKICHSGSAPDRRERSGVPPQCWWQGNMR